LASLTLTLTDMMDELGIHVNELNQAAIGPFTFSPALTVILLNQAQNDAVRRLNRNLTPELDQSSLANSIDSDGDFDITGLSPVIGNNGQAIDMIKITDSTSVTGYPVNLISFAQFRKLEDLNTTYYLTNPICYIRGDTLHLEPYSDDPDFDIYYRSDPAIMVQAGTNTDCVLGEDVKRIIMELALMKLFRVGRDYSRASEHERISDKKINELNNAFPPSQTTRNGVFLPGQNLWSRFPIDTPNEGNIMLGE